MMPAIERSLPALSVVIPTYNSTPTIGRTLASIEAPGCTIEILLIDDRSNDIEALREMVAGNPCIRLIEKSARTNAADSRAIGLAAAVHDIVFFLDSDDRFGPGHISRRLAMFSETDCGVVFGRFKLDDGKAIRDYPIPPFAQQAMDDYIFAGGGDCRSSTITVDRRRLNGTTFDRTLAQHQDWAFAIAAQRNGEIIAFDEQHGVIIDSARPARMSGRVRVDTSLAFLTMYLKSARARQGFLLGRLKASAKLRDRGAVRAFHTALRRARPDARMRAIALGIVVADRTGAIPALARLVAWSKRLGR